MPATTLTIETLEGEDPLNAAYPNNFADKAKRLRAFARHLMSVIGGMRRGGGATVRYGTAAASAVVTCATVVTGNTVTINGQALTATQHNSTGTVTCTASGIDAADTVTIGGIVLTARQHRAKGTITCSSADAADNVTIDGVTFVGTSGAVVLGEATYSVDTGNTEAATSLAAQINAHVVTAAKVTASSAAGVVTVRATEAYQGTAGNALTLATTDATDLAVSAATLTGGTALAAAGAEFDMSGTDAQVATSLGAAINAHPTMSLLVTAKVATNVVTVRAVTAGAGGDAITLASSDAQLAVSAATLASGATVASNQFDFTGTNTQTAACLVAALAASATSLVSGHVVGSNVAGVVTISAKKKGLLGNAITIASSGATLAITGSVSRLAGGTETAVNY